MKMSYRRAWMLIDNLNQCFRSPVVETQLGGTRGGGAVLSALGHDVIARYRAIERAAAKATATQLPRSTPRRQPARPPTSGTGRLRRTRDTARH